MTLIWFISISICRNEPIASIQQQHQQQVEVALHTSEDDADSTAAEHFSAICFYALLQQPSNVCWRFAAMQTALYEEVVCILHAWCVIIACIIHITAGNGLICWGKTIGEVSRVPVCVCVRMWIGAFRQNVIVLNLRFACEREMIYL